MPITGFTFAKTATGSSTRDRSNNTLTFCSSGGKNRENHYQTNHKRMATGLYWTAAALCAFIATLFLDIMGFFSGSNHFKVEGRAAAKDPQTQRFHSISADVTKPEENVRIISEVTAWNHGSPPDIVWANAGAAEPQLFVDTPIDVLRSQMDINYFAAAYLAQATLKSWLKPSSSTPTKTSSSSHAILPRHFIMTSSSVCFVGVGGYAPYAPAKAAMRSLADTLRSEVNMYNGARRGSSVAKPAADIKIHCVLPGTIRSKGLEHEEETKHPVTRILEDGDPVQTEDEVAAASVRGLEKGGFLITTQFLGHAMRAGALGGSPRNSRLVDTLFAWVVNLVWLFIGPDMENKVFKYGKEHGAGLAES
nr:3-ketodihydrosphingosine reductase tsc10 [Quercus suber]